LNFNRTTGATARIEDRYGWQYVYYIGNPQGVTLQHYHWKQGYENDYNTRETGFASAESVRVHITNLNPQ
jgi:hypothetical protein